MSAEPRRIHVRSASDGTFEAVILPPPTWQPLDRHSLPDLRAAHRAAWALKVVHGWPIVDETEGGGDA